MKILKSGRIPGILLAGLLVLGLPDPSASSSIIVEKNLFSPDRKPPSPDSETTSASDASPAVPPKALQLDGIFVYGDTRKALIRFKGQAPGKNKGKEDSPFVSVREGDKVSDYLVNKIGSKSVFLEKGGQTFELYLYASGKVLPPLAPSPPPQVLPGSEPEAGTIGDRRARRGQVSRAGAPPGLEGTEGAPGEAMSQRPRRMPRTRSPNDPRQQVQMPDEEIPDEMDEEFDIGEE